MPTKKPPIYMTAEEVRVALAKMEGDTKRTRLAALLQWRAGLRVSEALSIRPVDVDVYTNTLTVIGKGGKTRTLPLHPELRAELRASSPKNPRWPYLHHNRRGPKDRRPVRPIQRQTLNRRYAKYGIPTTHALRHSFARHFLSQGKPVNQLQLLLGHADMETTMRYLELTTPDPLILEDVS